MAVPSHWPVAFTVLPDVAQWAVATMYDVIDRIYVYHRCSAIFT
ncbi:hypothetical protein [Chloroflexus sp.]|nr:hypothetical protein [Chloroflexus sp.]MDW8405135.1 hypothetical protein [Chloroflexus sp.]